MKRFWQCFQRSTAEVAVKYPDQGGSGFPREIDKHFHDAGYKPNRSGAALAFLFNFVNLPSLILFESPFREFPCL
jgi:hypothetical protein